MPRFVGPLHARAAAKAAIADKAIGLLEVDGY